MAVLSKDDYMARVKGIVGENSDDESISLLEDLTDTYNDLEKRTQKSDVDWEKKYKDLDEQWRKRFQKRFYESDGGNPYEPEIETETEEEKITIDDLFKDKD